MVYQVRTIQYGEFEEIRKHSTIQDLIQDLESISMLKTVKVVDILENGTKLSDTRVKVLQSWAIYGY